MENIIIHGASGAIGYKLYKSLLNDNSKNVFGTFYKNNFEQNLIKFPDNSIEMFSLQKDKDIVFLCASPDPRLKSHTKESYIANYKENMKLCLNNLSFKNKLVVLLSSATTYHESMRTLSEKDIDYKKAPASYHIDVASALREIELFTKKKCSERKTSFLILRISSVYGKIKNNDILPGVIPDLIKKIYNSKDEIIKLNGSGASTRNFINIDDVIKIMSEIISEKRLFNNIINICSNNNTFLEVLVKSILNVIKVKKDFQFENNLRINSRSILSDFRYINEKNFISLSEGIRDISKIIIYK